MLARRTRRWDQYVIGLSHIFDLYACWHADGSINMINENNVIPNSSSIEEAMEIQSEDILELRYMTSDNCTFSSTPGGFVSLSFKDQSYNRVNFYKTFPFTDPLNYISVREVDEKAREIGIIKSLTDLNEEQRILVNEQLNIRYFTPIIEKIVDVKDEYGYAYFDVLTNYGPSKFTTHMGGGSVVSLTDTRLLITDIDGNRFEIPNINTLTAMELKKLDLFI